MDVVRYAVAPDVLVVTLQASCCPTAGVLHTAQEHKLRAVCVCVDMQCSTETTKRNSEGVGRFYRSSTVGGARQKPAGARSMLCWHGTMMKVLPGDLGTNVAAVGFCMRPWGGPWAAK